MTTPYCEPVRISDWSEPEEWDITPTSLATTDEAESDITARLALFEALAKALSVSHRQSLEGRFREQAEKWQRETAHLSSPLQRMVHPSYQAILGMGAEHKREVVGFLLHDMLDNHRDWSLALSYLTHANPISPKDAGRTDKIFEAWLNWGKQHSAI
jgi:hypothetical protein